MVDDPGVSLQEIAPSREMVMMVNQLLTTPSDKL